MKRIKYWAYVGSLAGSLGLALNNSIIVWLGMVDSTGQNMVRVYVNRFNEGWLEAILFPIFFIIGLVGLIGLAGNGRNDWK